MRLVRGEGDEGWWVLMVRMVYVRGDANVNPKHPSRPTIFAQFLSKHSLTSLNLHHNTHHHFMGGGSSDAQLDLLLYRGPPALSESLVSITCRLENPLIHSHHDLIVSAFPCPEVAYTPPPQAVTAPRVPNTRVKVYWDQEGECQYQAILASTLPLLHRTLSTSEPSPALTSILLDSTNFALSRAAEASFRTRSLAKAPRPRPSSNPEVTSAQKSALESYRHLRSLTSCQTATPAALAAAKASSSAANSALRAVVRSSSLQVARERDGLLHSVLSSDPTKLYSAVNRAQACGTPALHQLQVGGDTYTGDAVPDGFFAALSALKVPEQSSAPCNPAFLSASSNYRHILEICKAGPPLAPLTTTQAHTILTRLRADVMDLYSTTARHFLCAGAVGILHFTSLLNNLISDTNLSSIPEMNSAWSIMLHKGHGKPRSSSRSWRCISTCPLLAKALDLHVADLQRPHWAAASAPTQFMARGSSHELAALLLSEAISYATSTLCIPLWVLFLDKKAAFDSVLKEHVINAAFASNGHQSDPSISYLASRLASRHTYLEHNKVLMGPIKDQRGVEQGGISSSDQFQLVNNAELVITNSSGLGLNMGSISLASIGQADDVGLLSPNPFALQSLLHLSENFSTSTSMEMVPEKTKLLVYTPKGDNSTAYWQETTPITMGGSPLPLSTQAEHVGVLRSTDGGNLPALMSRLSAHGKSLYAVTSCGLARGHRGNPAASLRVEAVYCAPRLYSGLATLLLSRGEMDTLSLYQRRTLERLQRLYPRTPAPAIHFLSGTLPAIAILHLRQLSLLFMIARLGPSNPLHRHGLHALLHHIPNSWFTTLRHTTAMYSLQDPLLTLSSPPASKAAWKSLTKPRVTAYWRTKLIAEASALPSLQFLRPAFLALGRGAHPVWQTCGPSSSAVRAATIQARMLSGRYQTDWLRRHWAGTSGACCLPGCDTSPGDLVHLLTGACPALAPTMARTLSNCLDFLSPHPLLIPPLQAALTDTPLNFVSFVLDPSCNPAIILLSQHHGTSTILPPLFRFSRAWVWAAHRTRLRLLGLNQFLS